MKANIQFKEVGKPYSSSTSYTGDNITKEKIIDFFGLNNPDVEWFKIEIENN